MAENDNPNQGIGLQESMKQIADLLDQEEEGNQEEEAQSTASAVEPEYETEEVEYEGEPQLDEDTEEEEEQPQLYAVKVNGRKEEVTLDELLNGYSRASDYSQKTMELAERRKAFEANSEAVDRERQQYATLLPQLAQQLQLGGEEETPDWDKIYEADPLEAVKLERQWRTRKEGREKKLQAIQLEQQRLMAEAQKNQEVEFKKYLDNEKLKLPELIPEWKDQKVMAAEREEIKSWAVKEGILRPETVGRITDAGQVRSLRDSWLRARGKQKVKAVKKTASARGRTVRPGSTTPKGKNNARKTAESRLKQTGHWRDAADLISQMDLE